MQDFYTVPKAAKLIGISKPTLYKWVRLKQIPAYQFGNILFITYPDIQLKRIRKCSTCYHSNNGLCSCREASDIKPSCPDWYPIELKE